MSPINAGEQIRHLSGADNHDAIGHRWPNELNVYTQYLDFLGQFVIHCHILDHEDLGMMEVVEAVQPESVPLLARPMEHK
jgi:hypothetical protein